MRSSRGLQRRYATSSPNFGRKLGTVLAFAAGGLIACASGFALLDPEVPSARALPPATAQSSSGEKAAPVVITATPATPATSATAPAVEPKVTIAAPATEIKSSANPAVETKTAEPVIEPKVTNADTVKPCSSNAADDRKGDCDSAKVQKPGNVEAKIVSPAAVQTPPAKLRVPAAIAFEPAPLIAPPAKTKAPAGSKMSAKESETKSTENARPAKQAALSSTETPATDDTRPAAETTAPAEATLPAAEVAPAPVKPRKAVRTQSNRRSSYYDDRYYRHRNQNFFPFFR